MRFGELSCDVLVVGNGAAGCVAGMELAGRGHEVIVAGRGTTSTALSTGRVRLGARLREEADLLRVIGGIGDVHRLFDRRIRQGTAVTNQGTLAWQDIWSAHDWELDEGASVAVVGIRGYGDLDPDLACRALAETGSSGDRRPYWLDIPELPRAIASASRGDPGPLIDLLAPCIMDMEGDAAVLPPLLDAPRHSTIMDGLAKASGRNILEPATPLSLPGLRLQDSLEAAARRAGCLLWKDVQVSGISVDSGRATRVSLRSGMRELALQPRYVILATGNLVGSGMSVAGSTIISRFEAFETGRLPSGELSSGPLTEALSTGLRTVGGRVVCRGGDIASNVYAAGSAIAGLSFPLGRGLGEVMASGLEVARLVGEAV